MATFEVSIAPRFAGGQGFFDPPFFALHQAWHHAALPVSHSNPSGAFHDRRVGPELFLIKMRDQLVLNSKMNLIIDLNNVIFE